MGANLSNASDQLQPSDLDDYVAECDEHLSAARRVLLELETSRDFASMDREQLDALFRAFHTIKGLSGMVGAREAEQAAHALEAYLGAVRRGDLPLAESGIDALLEGVGLLEDSVGAFRGGAPGPNTSVLASRVAALMPSTRIVGDEAQANPQPPASVSGSLSEDKRAKLNAALLSGASVWQVTFSPTPDLAAQGVNVTTVRQRLQSTGEIVLAEPKSVPGGVRFQFLLSVSANTDLQDWNGNGLVVERYQLPAGSVAPPAVPRSGPGIAPAHLVRVDLARLDDLMRSVGDLVLSRARLEGNLAKVAVHLPPGDRRELEETSQTIERQLRDLREGVMRVRMVPVRDLFARMRLVVRDLSRDSGKEVELVVTGEGTEIDKLLVERMADPLLHLVRNAVAHGLETIAERTAAGKPAKGRLTLKAAAVGGMMVLEVGDDGRGVDVEAVFARARMAGLVSPTAPADPVTLLDLLCTPGFSTRDVVDMGSGRGVGMDVVRRAVEELAGNLTLDSRPRAGSRFTVRLPLTLVIADVLTISVGGRIYAVPQTAVREVVAVEPGMTTILENNELLRYHGGVLPLLRLGDVLGLPRPNGPYVALVSGEGTAAVAMAADRAIGLREVVVRSLADPLIQVPGIGGATELGDGRPILILDPPGLSRLARRRVGLLATRTGGRT